MGLMKNLAVFAPLLAALSAASPTPASAARQATPSYVPHTLNTTQEFYIHLKSTSGQTKYDGYTCKFPHFT
jgi:gamma-glutamyl:cysteine ligase YbdK (ATP-grasp superfamily)